MVGSKAGDVDSYLAELPEKEQPALSGLRDLFRSELTGFEELMAYGMPCYRLGDSIEAGFARQKRYVSVYVRREDMAADVADRLAGHDMGKGCLRVRNPDVVGTGLVRDLLRALAATPGQAC